jgi:hypothetical protein
MAALLQLQCSPGVLFCLICKEDEFFVFSVQSLPAVLESISGSKCCTLSIHVEHVRKLEDFACACRLLEVLTEQLQLRGSTETASHPDPDPELSHHPEGEDPTTRGLEPSPIVHPYTCLMQQAAELLADMHREQQTAADALEAMIDHLATAASPGGPELWGFAQRPSFLGDMPRCAAV